MFLCKQASRESTVNNLQHNWFATFGHCLFCIEWLLEEPFCVAEVFSMDWLRPLKLFIWFRTFRDARSGKHFSLDIKQPSSKSSSSSSAFWLNESPSSSSLSSPSSLSSSPARLIWKQFFGNKVHCYNDQSQDQIVRIIPRLWHHGQKMPPTWRELLSRQLSASFWCLRLFSSLLKFFEVVLFDISLEFAGFSSNFRLKCPEGYLKMA